MGVYNEELLDNTKGLANAILEVVLFVEAMIAVSCLKWRWMAKFFFYTEMLQNVCLCFSPHSYIDVVSPYYFANDAMLDFILLYCGQRFALLLKLLQMTFECTFGLFVAYDRPLLASTLITAVYHIFILTIFLACISAGVQRVSWL